MARRKNDDPVARLDELLREYTDEIRALVYTVLTEVDARLAGATHGVRELEYHRRWLQRTR